MRYIRSLCSLSYYRDAFSKGTGIRLWLALSIITVLNTAIVGYQAITFMAPFIHSLPQTLERVVDLVYPEHLVVTIIDGNLSINQPQPYVISVDPEKLGMLFGEKRGKMPTTQPIPFVVIDTEASADDFSSYHVPVLITKKSIVYQSEQSIRMTPLSDIPTTTITKQRILQYLNSFLSLPIITYASSLYIPLLLFAIFLGMFFYQFFAGILFMLLPIAIIAKLYGYKGGFSRFVHGVGVLYFSTSLFLDPIVSIPIVQQYFPWSLQEACTLALAYLALVIPVPEKPLQAAILSPAHEMIDALKSNRMWYHKVLYALAIFIFIWLTWWNVGKEIQSLFGYEVPINTNTSVPGAV